MKGEMTNTIPSIS